MTSKEFVDLLNSKSGLQFAYVATPNLESSNMFESIVTLSIDSTAIYQISSEVIEKFDVDNNSDYKVFIAIIDEAHKEGF